MKGVSRSHMRTNKLAIATVVVFALGFCTLWVTGSSNLRHFIDNLVALYFIGWGLYAFLSKGSREEITKQFLLMTGILAVSFALAESVALLNLVDYRGIFLHREFDPTKKLGFRSDPELVFTRPFHHQIKGTFTRGNIGEMYCLPSHPATEFELRYDQYGFRNGADLEFADIVVIGDSYIEAPMVPEEVLATSVLAKLQGQTVANLGMSGYGPPQELVVMKRIALNLRPKTLILVFFEGNDLEDARRYSGQVDALAQGETAFDGFWLRSFTRNALISLLELPASCLFKWKTEALVGTMRDQTGVTHQVYFAGVTEPTSALEIALLSQTQDDYKSIYQLCEDRGIRLVIAFAPSKFRVYKDLDNFEPVSQKVRDASPNDLPERFKTMIAEIAPDIEYVDLTVPLRKATGDGMQTYIPDDTHWTAEGHRVVGTALHEQLSKADEKT